jgi:glycosyltransferase involved in cell wall biosynthesis
VLLVAGQLVSRQMTIWKEASRQGVDLQIVGALRQVGAAGEWWRPEAPDWSAVHLVRPRGLPHRGQSWWYYPGLNRIIEEFNPDLIHILAEPWAVRVTQVLDRGVPVVVHSADNMYMHGGRLAAAIRSRRLHRVLPRLAGLVSWNSAGLELARSYGLPYTSPAIIAPAELPDPAEFVVDKAARAANRHELGLRPEDVAIGFFGRLEVEKGPLQLVHAFLDANLVHSRLFVFGSGSLKPALQARAAEAGNRIRLMGPISLERVPATAASMDIIVVPSVTTPNVVEQFSRVAVEAMMAGTAVVVSDCGALPEVVGAAALVVHEGSEGQLSAAMTRLATSEAARHELVIKGSERARRIHSPGMIAASIRRLWAQIVRA